MLFSKIYILTNQQLNDKIKKINPIHRSFYEKESLIDFINS